jgi:hypothetical protein
MVTMDTITFCRWLEMNINNNCEFDLNESKTLIEIQKQLELVFSQCYNHDETAKLFYFCFWLHGIIESCGYTDLIKSRLNENLHLLD